MCKRGFLGQKIRGRRWIVTGTLSDQTAAPSVLPVQTAPLLPVQPETVENKSPPPLDVILVFSAASNFAT
jgi:hypothetical protein